MVLLKQHNRTTRTNTTKNKTPRKHTNQAPKTHQTTKEAFLGKLMLKKNAKISKNHSSSCLSHPHTRLIEQELSVSCFTRFPGFLLKVWVPLTFYRVLQGFCLLSKGWVFCPEFFFSQPGRCLMNDLLGARGGTCTVFIGRFSDAGVELINPSNFWQ